MDKTLTNPIDRRWAKVLSGILVAGAILAAGWSATRRAGAREYRRFASPDGRFEIVAYRFPMMFCLPGGNSDAPGYFQLLDKKTDAVMHEQSVEMVQLVERVEWSPTNVVVHLLAEWKLPH